jgi:tRNA1(Val) A37 N6-methylase TrmN6
MTTEATTNDAILGGRLTLRQPRRGHRVGHDAILLAAATGAVAGEQAADLGAGIGAAGLALALRVPDLQIALVDVDPVLVALACDNIAQNRLADRARAVCLDVEAPAEAYVAAGCLPGSAHRVLMNPPFNQAPRHRGSPHPARQLARSASAETLNRWLASASRLLAPQGVLTMIWRADELSTVLGALAVAFGAIGVLPVHSRAGAPASRILVRAIKSSRAPLELLPSFFLRDAAGRPTRAAEAVLRDQAILPLATV